MPTPNRSSELTKPTEQLVPLIIDVSNDESDIVVLQQQSDAKSELMDSTTFIPAV